MGRVLIGIGVLACATGAMLAQGAHEPLPYFEYKVAWTHELKPHRRSIPLTGVLSGFHQLHMTVTVSTSGEVTDVKAEGNRDSMKFWPQVEAEVRAWRFTPFKLRRKPVAAAIDEYVDLVPPERIPTVHIAPPELRPNSKIWIKLERSGCFGSCPSYVVTVNSDGEIVFEGRSYVSARGRSSTSVATGAVRKLAGRFVDADFYSMDAEYTASVTDMPGSTLTISIDGIEKQVSDYVGRWAGMPAVISDLESEVDRVAQTLRWIK